MKKYTGFVYLCIILLLTAIAIPIVSGAILVVDHTMCKGVDRTIGGRYRPVDPCYEFTTDDIAYSYIVLGGVPKGDIVRWRWFDPTGTVRSTAQITCNVYTTAFYTYCYLDLATLGADMRNIGKWHVDIYVNQDKVLTEEFTVKKSV